MSKSKFSDKDVDLIKQLYKKEKNITNVAREFCNHKNVEFKDTDRRVISALLERFKITNNKKNKKGEDLTDKDFNLAKKRKLKASQYYLIAWEQNQSVLDLNLWNNILAYKKYLKAELSVILGRYKNPTSVNTEAKHDTWNIETKPYWDSKRHDIHKFLTILGDVKIQPTAADPLTGFESFTGERSTIVGHPKMHMMPVAALEGHPKKILMTTGAITKPNYTDSKAGKKGEFHHKMGFIIVEIKDDEIFFIRQVEADKDGNFIDLYHEVKDGKVSRIDQIETLVWGDTHLGSINEKILPATYKLIKDFKIKNEIHHDLIDGSSVNNHILKDPIQQFKRMKEGKDSVMDELSKIGPFLTQTKAKKYIIQSNHNDRFDRWIINHDWRTDLKNAEIYFELTSKVLTGEANKGIIPYIISKEFDSSFVECLDYDDSLILNGFELAHHGHIGSNGSKGSFEQFRKMSINIVLGHYHTPMRKDGVFSVGTSTHLREGYNKGASSWMNAHVILHKNKKAQHLIFVRGEFTTFK